MRAEARLRVEHLVVHGEVTDDHPSWPGEAVFLPWQRVADFFPTRAVSLERLGPARLELVCRRQQAVARTALEAHPEVLVTSSAEPPVDEPSWLATTIADRDHRRLAELAQRDAVSKTRLVRSLVQRELMLRQLAKDLDREPGG